MGTFCRNCGRALADGEVCHCTDPVQTENTATEQTTNNIPTQPNTQQAQGNTQMPNMGGQFNQQQFNQQMPNMNQFNPQMQNGQFNHNMQNQFNPNMQNRQFNPHMPNMNGMGNSFNNGFNSVKESGNLKGMISAGLVILGLIILIIKSASFGNTLYTIAFIISAVHIYKNHKMYGGQISIVQYFKSMLTDKSNTPFLQNKVFAFIIAILPIMIILGLLFASMQADQAVNDSINYWTDYLDSLY
jgi:hypothetical protein